MSGGGDVLAIVATGAGVVAAVLLGVWRIVRFEVGEVRRDLAAVDARLTGQIGEVESRLGARIDALDARLTAEIGEVNRRIDAVLLADRDARRAS